MSRYKEGCCGVCRAGLELERAQAAAAPSPSATYAQLLAEYIEARGLYLAGQSGVYTVIDSADSLYAALSGAVGGSHG